SEFPAADEGSSSGAGGELQQKDGGGDGGGGGASGEGERFMTALGLLKLREEADPFSMDIGVLRQGDIVKVLETNGKWVRVAYHGREDGWTLTANKRGPTMSPMEGDVAAAALAFTEQKANFAEAEAAAASAAPSGEDRPLTGAKPAGLLEPTDRPDTVTEVGGLDAGERKISGPRKSEGAVTGGGVGDDRREEGAVGGDGVEGSFSRFMTSMGPIKIRDEADACAMDLGVVAKGDIVKVLEMNGLWARVAYRGKSDGWVLTANKRGAMLTPEEDEAAAEALWSEQERTASSAEAECTRPQDPNDR
ncbi:unnamed protein product, partial [Sphacelaria rigidula]